MRYKKKNNHRNDIHTKQKKNPAAVRGRLPQQPSGPELSSAARNAPLQQPDGKLLVAFKRPLADGSYALGIFNVGDEDVNIDLQRYLQQIVTRRKPLLTA